MRMNYIGLCLLVALCCAAVVVPACAAAPVVIPPGASRTVRVTARKGDTILAVEGRFVGKAEDFSCESVALSLDGQALTGERIVGSNRIIYPLDTNMWQRAVARYSTKIPGFRFLMDTDYLDGNGPFSWNENEHRHSVGCPPLLQLQVADLLTPGAHTVTLQNAHPTVPFEYRLVALRKTATVTPEPLLFPPSWTLFAVDASYIPRYLPMLYDPEISAENHARLLTAFGTGEYMRPGGDPLLACSYWERALATGTTCPFRSEVAYFLTTQRRRLGRWPSERTEALVRAAVTGKDSWSEGARTLLALIDNQPLPGDRLIVRPTTAQAPVTVDGSLREDCWAEAIRYAIDKPMGRVPQDRPCADTQIRCVVQETGLVFGVTGTLPDGVTSGKYTGEDQYVWEENCVEIFLATDVDLTTYIELNVTPFDARFDAKNHWNRLTNMAWNGVWQCKITRQGQQFTMETFVPWADFGWKTRPAAGTILPFIATRYVMPAGCFYTLTPHRAYNCHRLQDAAFLIMP